MILLSICWIFMRVLLLLVTPAISAKCERRVTLKFLTKSGCTPIQCWRRLHDVWGDATMSKMQVREWHKRFKNGLETVNDAPRTG